MLCGADVVPTLSTHSLDRLRSDALEIALERREKRRRRRRKNSSLTAATLSLSGSFLPPLPSLLAAGISSSFPSSSFVRGMFGAAAQGWRGRASFAACLIFFGALLGLALAAAAAAAAKTAKPAPAVARAALFPPGRILHLVPSEVLLEASAAAAALSEAKVERESHGDESDDESDCGCGGEGRKERKEGDAAAALSPVARSPPPPPGSGTVILAAVPHEACGTIRPHRRMLRDHYIPAHLEALDAAAAAFVASASAAAAARAEGGEVLLSLPSQSK